MKYLFLVTVLLSQSFLVHAECGNAYKDQVKNLETRMNPPRAAIIGNAIGEGVLVATLAAVTGTVPIAGAIALPAAGIGAGIYYAILIAQRDGLRNAMHLISDAHKGDGKTLNRFLKLLKRRMKNGFDKEEVIRLLVQGDFDNTFCVLDDVKDKYDLMSFRKILRYTKKELTNVDDASFEQDKDIDLM